MALQQGISKPVDVAVAIQHARPRSKAAFMRSVLSCVTALHALPLDNLFRVNCDVKIVRGLQLGLYQGNYSIDSRYDSHTIASTLLQVLKDMDHSLLLDIYEEVLSTEITEDYSHTKVLVVQALSKLDEVHFELVQSLFILLFNVSRANELNSTQLSQVISPYICKRKESSFMSIRHVEELRRIKSVITFIIDHFDEIHREVRPSPAKSNSLKTVTITRPVIDSIGTSNRLDISKPKSPSSNLTPLVVNEVIWGTEQLPSKHRRQHEADPFQADFSLLVETEPVFAIYDNSFVEKSAKLDISLEMTILRSLVVQKVESFLKAPLEFCDSTARSKRPSKTHKSVSLLEDTDSGHSEDAISECDGTGALTLPTGFTSTSSTQQHSGTSSSVLRQSDLDLLSSNLQRVIMPSSAPDKSKRKLDEELSSRTRSRATNHANDDDGGVFQQPPKAVNNIFRMSRQGISQRRRMVIECKSLRSQIATFEDTFMKDNGRIPKGNERGQMTDIYNQYRDMKKCIRDGAAVDIQKIVRRYLTRVQFSRKRKTFEKRTDASSSNNGTTSVVSAEWLSHYRNLLNEKRDLKRSLKKFDDDFAAAHGGHQPRKADKEIMRPMYQRYHDVKAELDSTRAAIENSHGALPEELREENVQDSRAATPVDARFMDDEKPAKIQSTGATIGFKGITFDSQSVNSGDESEDNHVAEMGTTEPVDAAAYEAALLEEKRNLHAYLKSYEREFNRINGRPVQRHEDIQPVAHEYERYKDVKALIEKIRSG